MTGSMCDCLLCCYFWCRVVCVLFVCVVRVCVVVERRSMRAEKSSARRITQSTQKARTQQHQQPLNKQSAAHRGLGAGAGVLARAVGARPLERLAARRARPACCFFVESFFLSLRPSSFRVAAAASAAPRAARTHTHTQTTTPAGQSHSPSCALQTPTPLQRPSPGHFLPHVGGSRPGMGS